MKKKFLSLILVGLLTVMLAGCGIFGGGEGKKDVTVTLDPNGGTVKKSVTITLDPNGGIVSKVILLGKAGSAMELPVPTRDGYEFDKWYEGEEIVSQTEFPASDTLLTARYYAENSIEKTVTVFETPLNVEHYTGENKNGSVDEDVLKFSAPSEPWTSEQKNALAYLKRNNNIMVTIRVKFEWYAKTKNDAILILYGSSDGDKLYNITGYQFSPTSTFLGRDFSVQTTSKTIAGSRIVCLYIESFSYLYPITCRNVQITLAYTEAIGTLV